MKKAIKLTSAFRVLGILLFFGLVSLISSCNNSVPEAETEQITESPSQANESSEVIWHVKAVHNEGVFIDIKAVDNDGNTYDVKAIQDSDQSQFMDIKAFVGEQRIPIKILVSEDQYNPVKAISEDGTIYDIKAITADGDKIDVKGISRFGNIVNIKAINKDGSFFGIKAISPEGQLNDVKGIKMTNENIELMLNGVEVFAHIKALPQAGSMSESSIWHIKAIHPEGRFLSIKALDNKGNTYDVKAIQDSNQRQFMDIKAFIGNEKLPIKILVSDDKYAPVKAIGMDGTTYDIKALTPEGDKLDVKGVSHSGNIINIKAIDKDGALYGIKAISKEGQLNDVKGFKMTTENIEMTLNGVKVHAHIKAIPQKN